MKILIPGATGLEGEELIAFGAADSALCAGDPRRMLAKLGAALRTVDCLRVVDPLFTLRTTHLSAKPGTVSARSRITDMGMVWRMIGSIGV